MSTTDDITGRTLEVERREDGIAVVSIDVPGRPVNVLDDALGDDLAAVLDALGADDAVRGAVLTSGKAGGFLAGADVHRLQACRDEGEAHDLAARAQRLTDRIEGTPLPVVAAVHGACLGAGLELALACDECVARADGDTVFAAPEVRLGLLPGAGGTVRLPRAIGARKALDMMLTGRKVPARRARADGLVDEIVPGSLLLEAAARRALRLAGGPQRSRSLLDRLWALLDRNELEALALEENPVGRKLLFDQAARRAEKAARGHDPAPGTVIDVVRTGLEEGDRAGLAAEREAFGRLATSGPARRLMELFLGRERLGRRADTLVADREAPAVERLGIVGAGLMGGGIAAVSADGRRFVRLVDVDDGAVAHGLGVVEEALAARVGRKRLDPREAGRRRHMVTATTGRRGLAGCGLILEAVPEDEDLKKEVLAGLGSRAPDAVLATNTSSIPIDRLAAVLRRPDRLVGMHYFSPVETMPLVEIVRGPRTSEETLATAVRLGREQGKTPVIVGDGPGFYTTRILAPCLIEACLMVEEGTAPRVVDEALEEFGFPVGPLRLADAAGLEVAAAIVGILHDAFGARMTPPRALRTLVDDGRTGRRAGRGFYRYDGDGREDDPALSGLLGGPERWEPPAAHELTMRCALRLVDEAVRCLDDGVLTDVEDGDLAAVLGLGFPPFRGGPFRFVGEVGAGTVVEQLDDLAARHGDRLAPGPGLRARAREQGDPMP